MGHNNKHINHPMEITIKEKFVPTEFGWVSHKTPPTNHNSVVVLLWLENEKIYQEMIGFYEDQEWHLSDVDDDDYEVLGWFPFPYTPHNH
jgi:hypothetical protein